MIESAVTAGLLVAFLSAMWVLARWMSRSISQLERLGTVSRQWLALHRAEDK